jgi:hypothetical protein
MGKKKLESDSEVYWGKPEPERKRKKHKKKDKKGKACQGREGHAPGRRCAVWRRRCRGAPRRNGGA